MRRSKTATRSAFLIQIIKYWKEKEGRKEEGALEMERGL